MALKPSFCFVSTMNQEYYNVVGKEMIDSFLQYTPENFSMRIYAENVEGILPKDFRLDYYDWNVYCKKPWENFITKTDNKKEHKFAKKGFAFLHALLTIDERYFVWVDADIVFKKTINDKIIKDTIKNNFIGLFDHSYLNKKGYSAESGYVIIDTEHSQFKDFCKTYEEYYTTRPTEIKHWWDGQVLMLAASKFKKIRNLSQHRTDDKTHTPLNDSYLGEYIYHMKGKFAKRYHRNSKRKFRSLI